MVMRANTRTEGIGGHLSTYASSAALYEVGFNHFFRGKADGGFGDQVFFQGHASPGIYARAFVEGRLTEEELDNFRHEVGGDGLPSYPHPRSLPDFWEFPTVSMGLGPISAIYQAHVNRYLNLRRLVDTSASRVWCFVGDGEMDEPESIGALGVAGREHLDNLIFVVNCNLQRLDGPVRGNGKIIQELEAVFRGAGWNVIKVIWGSRWDALLAKDVDGVLLDRMNTTVDGEYQKLATESGAYIREHFFGPDPRLRKMVEDLSDDELVSLPRGGHDYRKLYAAYKLATEQKGAPTVILAKTIKGWTLGPEIEARNATHQIKKMTKAQLRALRDRLYLTDDIPDAALEGDPPYIRPAEGSDAMEYLRARGRVLDGPLPVRVVRPRRAPAARRQGLRGVRRRARASSRSRPPWCSPACCATSSATRRSARSWRPSSPTRPAPSGSSRSSPRRRSTRPTGRTTCRSTPTCPLNYAESTSGQVLQEGITEAGALADVHRAGHRLRHLGPADGAGLPLLFDVRLPAGGRPGLGARRHARPGHPGRLHGRADHPHGRGAAARRRAVAPARLHQPGRHGLRRLLRLRGGRHHGGGRRRDARARTPRTASGTSRSTTRPTRCRALPEGEDGDAVRRGIIDGALPLRRRARRSAGRPAGLAVLLGPDVERRHGGAAHPGRALRRRPPTPGP